MMMSRSTAFLQYLPTLCTILITVMSVSTTITAAQGSLLPRLTYQNLQARNLSTFFDSIPIQCEVQCDIVKGAAQNCQFLACACTNEHSLQLQTCVNCIVALTPTADGIVDEYQGVLDEWTNSYCEPFPTPPLHVSLPGSQSSSSTSSSSSTTGPLSSVTPDSATAKSFATKTVPSISMALTGLPLFVLSCMLLLQ